MKHPLTRVPALAALAATSLAMATAGSAAADAPSFDRCPRSAGVSYCVVSQSSDGSIAANGHRLSLASAGVKVEGGLSSDLQFVPPATGDALTAKPVPVPGGLFGTNLPYKLNAVTATIQQAGPIGFDAGSQDLTAPIKVKFTNPLLGSRCYIGSDASPIVLHLTAGLVVPPPPNQPIAGQFGTLAQVPGTVFAVEGQVQVDNAFAVPAATGCGIVAQAQVTKAINDNLGLPSAAGHYNDATLTLSHYYATA